MGRARIVAEGGNRCPDSQADSRGAATDYSPRRKPWGRVRKTR